MNTPNAGGDEPMTGAPADRGAFAIAVQSAYREAHLHRPQGIPDVAERLRGKLDAHGVTLTDDVLAALAFAIVNGRGL